jgi:hypothetical protein
MKINLRVRITVMFCLLVALLGPRLLGQAGGKGTIQGTITDPSGAIIPNAEISVTQTSTSTVERQKSTGAGFYSISSLDPGTYTVTVAVPGFQNYVQENVRLDALQVFGLNIKLVPGGNNETITVSDAPPAIDSTNATLGNVLENETYEALPLNMGGAPRDPTAFVFLTAGVASSSAPYGSFNGGQGFHNEDYIEGLAVTNAAAAGGGNTASITRGASVDAIDQFQVQTSGTSAAYSGQGVENYTLKSGTNQFHGRAFEYFRNTVLDTWGFVKSTNIITGAPVKPVERQNEYGGTLGGPLLHNKLFFFASYDGQRYLKGTNPSYLSVPTLAERAGDFRALLTNTPAGCVSGAAGCTTTGQIYDPLTTVCTSSTNCTRQQFVSDASNVGIPVGTPNVIPMSRLSPQSTYYQNLIPLPSNGNLQNNYLAGFNTGFNYYKVSLKLDYDLSVKQRMTLLLLTGTRSANPPCCDGSGLPPPFTNTVGNFQSDPTGVIEDTYTINDHFINQFKYGVVRSTSRSTNPGQGSPAFAATAAGITNVLPGQASQAAPRIGFSGNNSPTSLGGTSNSNNQANSEYSTSFVLYDTMQLVKGRHSMNFGGQYEWLEDNDTSLTSGTYLNLNYGVNETARLANTNVPLSTTGNAYASYLAGAVDSISQVDQRNTLTTGARFYGFSPFFQDDIKLTKRLTVNLGLRWDLYSPFREVQNRLSFLSPTDINTVTGTHGDLTFAGYGQGKCNCDRANQIGYKNFGPRVGFAYAVDPTTVVRGSYGISFTRDGGAGGRGGARQGASQLGFSTNNSLASPDGYSPVFYLNASNSALPAQQAPTPTPTFGTGYSTVPGYNVQGQGVTFVDPYLSKRPPYYENYNFGVQQELAKQLTASIDYTGSAGRFLPTGMGNGANSDQLDPKYMTLLNQYTLSSGKSAATLLSAQATPANVALVQQYIPGYQLPYPTFGGGSFATVGQSLRPYPQFSGVTDIYGDFGMSSYNSLQSVLTQKTRAGASFTLNYTWSKLIDNTGSGRTAYNHAYERSLSLYDHTNAISAYGVYAEPFGHSDHFYNHFVRGYVVSGVYTFTSGTPLAVVGSGCVTVSAGTCEPNLNPSAGPARQGGNYGRGLTAAQLSTTQFINPLAFSTPANYTFGNAPRTAPYGLRGPGGYTINMSLRRTFGLLEGAKLMMEADAINLLNRTNFGNPNTTLGGTSFGTVGVSGASRDIQLAARIEF